MEKRLAFDDSLSHRWFFCMTHPDDELAIAGWIHHLTSKQIPVWMCWTHSTPRRELESREAAQRLGVSQENLFFLNAPDRGVLQSLPTLIPTLQNILEEIQPTRIACGAFEQGHIDHDATNLIINQVASCPVLEIPFYHTYITRMPIMGKFANSQDQEIRHLSKEEVKLKIELAKTGYPSQKIWKNVFYHEIRQGLLLQPRTLATIEKMRFQTHFDFFTPHLPSFKKILIKQTKYWKQWASLLNSHKEQYPNLLANHLQ